MSDRYVSVIREVRLATMRPSAIANSKAFTIVGNSLPSIYSIVQSYACENSSLAQRCWENVCRSTRTHIIGVQSQCAPRSKRGLRVAIPWYDSFVPSHGYGNRLHGAQDLHSLKCPKTWVTDDRLHTPSTCSRPPATLPQHKAPQSISIFRIEASNPLDVFT